MARELCGDTHSIHQLYEVFHCEINSLDTPGCLGISKVSQFACPRIQIADRDDPHIEFALRL